MRAKGFTLLELLVVLFIVGILLALFMPRIGSQVSYYRFHNAVGGFKTAANLAKIRSMAQGGGVSPAIWINQISRNNDDESLTLSVGKDPHNSEAPEEHNLSADRSYYVTLVDVSPQAMHVRSFPWSLNDRLFECSAPDKKSLRCKLGDLRVKLDPDPMAVSGNAIARVATAIRLTGHATGEVMDASTKTIMLPGDYFKINDKNSVIEYQYNKNNMTVMFIELDDKGNTRISDCGTTPSCVVFDHRGFTRDSATYEIVFKEIGSGTEIPCKIMPSGVSQ